MKQPASSYCYHNFHRCFFFFSFDWGLSSFANCAGSPQLCPTRVIPVCSGINNGSTVARANSPRHTLDLQDNQHLLRTKLYSLSKHWHAIQRDSAYFHQLWCHYNNSSIKHLSVKIFHINANVSRLYEIIFKVRIVVHMQIKDSGSYAI